MRLFFDAYVAVDGGEDAVAPLERCLVADSADGRGSLDRHVPAHELDERDPRGKVLLAVLEDGSRKGAEPSPARRASEALVPCRRAAVLAYLGGAARRAFRLASVCRNGLVECPEARPVAASPCRHGPLQLGEVII